MPQLERCSNFPPLMQPALYQAGKCSQSDDNEIKHELLENYPELLKERIIIDAQGEEILNRLSGLLSRANEAAQKNQKPGESLSRAVIRNALILLSNNFDKTTLGGLPTGPAYERPLIETIAPQNIGHEKVGYPMSDYPQLSFLPVGGLGAPLCEIDYSTCYIREGFMIQDKPIRQISININGKDYDLAKTQGTYYALYPFSERSYNLPIPFSIQQYSPVIPGDYQASSLPVEIMELVTENTTDNPLTFSFSLGQENILGWYPKDGKDAPKNPHAPLIWNRQSQGNYAEAFVQGDVTGLLFRKKGNLTGQVRVGSGLGGQIAIASLSAENVDVLVDQKTNTLKLTVTLQPGEKISHPITIAYDLPFYNFQSKAANTNSPGAANPDNPGVRMPKEYTRYYDATGGNAQKIASDALDNYEEWKNKIVGFQNIIVGDPELPDFFKQALLNELYVLPETGIWEASQNRFAYLESIDYKMYNTSDVNSYTWALLTLYPELEKRDLLELAKMVPLTDPTHRWWGTDRWANIPPAEWKHLYWEPIKDQGAVCHDLGGLLGEGIVPFTNRCNEFNWSNANMWIDLAPKFALRAMRYFTFMREQTGTADKEFISTVYPAVKLALDTLEKRWGDKNHGTHVPVSKGVPDWTYDTISGEGYTPNVVTQWLAALQAAQIMASMTGDIEAAARYQDWQETGKPVMDKLWNECGYYNAFTAPGNSQPTSTIAEITTFNSSISEPKMFCSINPCTEDLASNKNIHSDMLFGDFYARMAGLEPVVSNERAARSLEMIYKVNGQGWSKVGNRGPLGLVNLRGAAGEQNKTEQGDEGWIGTMLLNAAYQIKVGQETENTKLVKNGWNIIQGFYNVVYSSSSDSQHWFGRTPEGYVNPNDVRFNDGKKTYGNETGRAPKYMRALAIWAVYAALKNNRMPFNIYGRTLAQPDDNFYKPFGVANPACE
ncbi:MAG: GH116 family glycosyl hydrolase [Candidatus Margulisbacteria bacterium]|nr:GH116 family glycosyl hydrolase [Candidatus Margulisiibacteriota bacterium]